MLRDKKEIRSLFIECKEWFDKSGGNSYHSVAVWINGKCFAQESMTYGYGSQYLTTALEVLIGLGFDFEINRPLWFQVEEIGADLYRSRSWVNKKELFKYYRIEDTAGL